MRRICFRSDERVSAKFSLPIGFAAIALASLLHAWQAATDPAFDPTPAAPDLPPDPS